MKELSFEKLEEIQGGSWSTASFLCGVGFGGFWGIIETGFWAAGVATGGIGIALGLGVMLIGAAVCSLAPSDAELKN